MPVKSHPYSAMPEKRDGVYYFRFFNPVLASGSSESWSECSQICYHSRGDQHITNKIIILFLEIFSCLRPTINSKNKIHNVLLSDTQAVTHRSFSPPSPPMSFWALSSFLAQLSTCFSSFSFFSVISWNCCLREARRSSTCCYKAW